MDGISFQKKSDLLLKIAQKSPKGKNHARKSSKMRVKNISEIAKTMRGKKYAKHHLASSFSFIGRK